MTVPTLAFRGLTAAKKFINPSYRVGLKIYPHRFLPDWWGGRGVDKPITVDWNKRETEASCIGFESHKVLGQAAGMWSATFKAVDEKAAGVFEEIGDGDWADVVILRNGVKIPMLRGVVDACRERKASAAGATTRVWTVSGRDHGAVFDAPITYTSFFVRNLGQILSGLQAGQLDYRTGGRPDQIFAMLIEAALKKGTESGSWELPPSMPAGAMSGGARFADILRIVVLSASRSNAANGLRGALHNQMQLWATGEQSLHAALSQWCNPLLNEIFYDLLMPSEFVPENGLEGFLLPTLRVVGGTPGLVGDPLNFEIGTVPKIETGPSLTELSDASALFSKPAAWIRERPFPSTVEGRDSAWFHLPTWHVPDWLLLESDLVRGGHERHNVMQLMFDVGNQNEQHAVSLPCWDQESVRTHGLHEMNQRTQYIQFRGQAAEWFPEREKWQRLLVDWFGVAPYQRSGQITIKALLPEIRIGQRLIIDTGGNDSEQFYIEGVANIFRAPTSGQTTLTVTHGFRGTDAELLSRVGEISRKYEQVVKPIGVR